MCRREEKRSVAFFRDGVAIFMENISIWGESYEEANCHGHFVGGGFDGDFLAGCSK